MKAKYNQTIKLKSLSRPWQRGSFAAGMTAMLAITAALLLSGVPARAQVVNLLANPGAETGNFNGWTEYNNAGYNFGVVTASQAAPHGGTYSFWIYGDYNYATEYNGFYQFVSAFPGEVFNADGWEYQLTSDCFCGANDGNNAFLEVTFQDINGNTLARYRSVSITNGSPTGTYMDLGITNQYDPITYAFLGTVTNLVAPANTFQAEYNVVFNLVNYGGGSTYWDDLELLANTPPLPYLTNIVPNNVILATNQDLTFSAVSPTGAISNITMTVTTTSGLVNPTNQTTVYNSSVSTSWGVSGLGTPTASVNFPLTSNMFYNISILAFDTNGNHIRGSTTLDTLQPVLVWEAEDFNFSGGDWMTNITADGGTFAYTNEVGTPTIDEQDANPGNTSAPHHYRPGDGVSMQGAYEVTPGGAPITRQKFINFYAANPAASTNPDTVDEEVGYNNNGDWLDYTRNFPAGKYNVYARLATSGGGAQCYFETVTGNPTQPNQTVTTNGTFSMTDNNWNVYQYVPLLDQYGNLVSVSLGGTQTVRVQIAPGGNPNENFYMIMPAVPPQNPVLQGIYPDGVQPFEATNHFTFTIGQGNGAAITAGNVHLVLNGYDVTPQVTFTSTATNWTGTIPIVLNSIYNAVITATNSTHLSSTYTVGFDTFSQSLYMWEAEDYDFAGGGFIDNPVPSGDSVVSGGIATGTYATNSYYYWPEDNNNNAALVNVDVSFVADSGMTEQYRPLDTVGTQVAGDFVRQKFLAAQTQFSDPNVADFNIGYYNAGDWLNYTRNYPAGSYNVYARLAGGAGPFSGTFLSLVTSGWGTDTQTTNVLGYFADPNAVGWQTWHWIPMLDTNNNLVTVQFNGSTNTLKLTSGNNLNVNFMMLVPVPTPPTPVSVSLTPAGSQFHISFATQVNHSYKVLYSSNVQAPINSWSTLTVVEGDGTTKTVTDTARAAARFYQVVGQ